MKPKDLTGLKFGKLLALKINGSDSNGAARWDVLCDCGNTKNVSGCRLRRGHVKSCGCIKTGRKPLHGMSFSSEHRAWASMIYRCENKNAKNYHRYGGRGISVSNEWRNDFNAFLRHVGRKPSPEFVLDRINNDGNYEPGNVRWVDPKKSAANRRGHESNITNAKGVSYINGIYRTVFEADGKILFRKRFKNLIDAAIAYNDAAKKHHGEYAYLNNIESLRKEVTNGRR